MQRALRLCNWRTCDFFFVIIVSKCIIIITFKCINFLNQYFQRFRYSRLCIHLLLQSEPPPVALRSRQYLILCTRRLSLFLNFFAHLGHTTLVGSECTFLMCMQTRLLAYPTDLFVEFGKYPQSPHWYVNSPSLVRTNRKAKCDGSFPPVSAITKKERKIKQTKKTKEKKKNSDTNVDFVCQME